MTGIWSFPPYFAGSFRLSACAQQRYGPDSGFAQSRFPFA